MIDTAPPSENSEWLQDANSFLVSAICHLVALLIMGLITLAPRNGWEGISLVAQLGDGSDAIADDEGSPALESNEDQFAAAALEELLASQAVDAVALETVAVDAQAENPMDAALDEITSAQALDRALAEMSGQGGGKGRFGSGGGAVDGDGNPFGKEDGFFGIGDSGETLVYVVDCSDSMNDGGKWRRATKELVRALEELSYDQRYFIIFFSDGAYPMDADAPIPATYEEVDHTRRWVNRIVPDGGTNPLPALLYALSLEPDAIYFLSDGQFDPMVIPQLQQRNPRSTGQIPIHTISFVNRATVGLMRTIARQSGGEFRYVK